MKKNQKEEKTRMKWKRAARRSGKTTLKEDKVTASNKKKKFTVSQKRTATIKKSRY